MNWFHRLNAAERNLISWIEAPTFGRAGGGENGACAVAFVVPPLVSDPPTESVGTPPVQPTASQGSSQLPAYIFIMFLLVLVP